MNIKQQFDINLCVLLILFVSNTAEFGGPFQRICMQSGKVNPCSKKGVVLLCHIIIALHANSLWYPSYYNVMSIWCICYWCCLHFCRALLIALFMLLYYPVAGGLADWFIELQVGKDSINSGGKFLCRLFIYHLQCWSGSLEVKKFIKVI